MLCAASVEPARAESFGEAEVIARARASAPENAAAAASIELARSEELRASLWSNPSLSWRREQLGSPSEPEDSLELTVPLPLGGSRSAQRALSRASAAGSRAQAARARSAVTTRALEAFYAALGADREAAVLRSAVERLDEAVRVATRRHQEGAISGYERTRLELETELLRTELHAAQAAARSFRARLAELLGTDAATLELRGELAVSSPELPARAQPRASLVHLRSAEQRAREAQDAAGLAWIPELSLSAGVKRLESTETRYGYLAGASLSLPVASHGQDVAAESAARAGMLAAEASVIEREARVQVAEARGRLRAAHEELQRFVEATAARVELVERAAASAYRDGQSSVVELVDAQRARTEVERRKLVLELLARQAELELRAARGDFE